MEKYTMFTDYKIRYIYRFNVIPIKIPTGCLSKGRRNYKLILIYTWEDKEPERARVILNKPTRITRSDI